MACPKTGQPTWSSDKSLKCRCQDCKWTRSKASMTAELRKIERDRGAQFPTDMVPREPARVILMRLSKLGYSQNELVRLTGCNAKTFTRIRHRRGSTFVYRKVYDALVAVYNEDQRSFEPNTEIPAKKSRQIIKSLAAQGWTYDHQMEILRNNRDINAGFLKVTVRNRTKYIRAINAQHIQWLGKTLGEQLGPSESGRVHMRARGFFSQKHYSMKGDLIVSTLTPEQREFYKSVQSSHG